MTLPGAPGFQAAGHLDVYGSQEKRKHNSE